MDLTDVQLLQSIWAALRRIEDNMALPPAPLEPPLVHIDAPDLGEIVSAVTGLKPGPTAEEIAAAIAAVLRPDVPATAGGAEALDAVAAALKNLDFRLKGMGTQAYGGGAVHLDAGATVGISGAVALDAATLAALETISVANFPATQPVSGIVAVSNLPATQPVSGTVAVSNLPATQPVSGTVSTLEGTGLVPKVYDYLSLGYTGSDLTTVVYKAGGSGGTTVATLTMTYSAGILQTVTRT